MKQGKSTIPELLAVNAIRTFLQDKEADRQARGNWGWTPEKREEMLRQCSEIVQQPHWRDRVLTTIRSEDEVEFFDADRAAGALGIDAWPFLWERLKKQPLQSSRWFGVMRDCNESRIADVVAFAESTLPLQRIASGPGTEMGLGPAYEAQSCLGYILQDLGRFPRHGIRLIETGLRCQTIRNRNVALKALAEWGKEMWPANVISLLESARDREPDQDVRRRITNALAGRPLEQNE
jgi:hypothetical protein